MTRELRVVIADDERASLRALEIQLEALGEVRLVGTAQDGSTAIDLIRSRKPDLVFLDVQMPDVDGFGVLEALDPDELPLVVFVTAYDEFAIRAFEVNAVDYLLKPVDDRKLRRALDRAREGIGAEARQPAGVLRLLEHLDPESGRFPGPVKKRILVKHKGEYFFVRAETIEWIEAEGNYARIHVEGGNHLIRASLTELDASLDPNLFLRVHRGAIVNLDFVDAIQPYGVSDYRVILRSGGAVKVGRTYRDRLLQRQS